MTDQPNIADMAAFGASEYACYRWPGEEDQALRAAFCEGAAHAVSHIELTQTEVDLIAACASTPDILILASVTELEALKHDLERCQNNLASAEAEIDRLNRPAPRLPTDTELRKMWRHAGGGFHGPNVEHGYMPEHLLLPFLRSLLSVTSTRPPDIESLCHDYAQRWLGQDWHAMDEDIKADLHIEAHRWLKCWAAVTSTKPHAEVREKEITRLATIEECRQALDKIFAARNESLSSVAIQIDKSLCALSSTERCTMCGGIGKHRGGCINDFSVTQADGGGK